MRGNMMRVAGSLAAIAMVVGGCNCPGPAVDCTDTTIIFDTPTSGMTVDAPFDVSINVKSPDGTAFNIDAATLTVGGMSFTGTVTGNRATFSGVSAPAGEQTLSVAIAKDTCSKTATSTVTVRDTCSTPSVTAVSFPQDTGSPLGVLNAAEIPSGTNLQVKVDATCVSGVQVRIKRGTMTVGGPADFVNGTVTMTLATLPDSDNMRYDLFAELVRDGTAINMPTGAALGSIQVTRATPMVTLTTQPSYGPADDANTAMMGFQVRVTGTAPVGTSCSISVPGATPPTQAGIAPAMNGDVSADFTVTSGMYTATLTCTDGAGNSGMAMSSFTVDFDPPVVTITSPANVDGGATMVVTASPLLIGVSATGAADGSSVVIRVTGPSGTGGTSMLSGGTATVPVSFGLDGTYTITVEVTDSAGNVGSATITVIVQLSGCGAAFSRPMVCPTLLTPAQLVNGTYGFQTTSNAVCSGQPARLFRADVAADGGIGTEVAAGTATLNASGVATFPALTLASGDFQFRAEVTNPADAGVSQVSCAVTVDLDGPSITSPVVPGGAMFATVNAQQDTQPMTPGVQRALTFTARVPQGGRIDVCTTQAIDPVTMMQRSTSPECGMGFYLLAQGVVSPVSGFTFPEGTYDLKIVVVGSGLPTAPASNAVPVLSDATRPCLLASSRRLPQDTNMDGRLNITELGANQPQIEFQLDPMCGGTMLAATNAVVLRDIVGGMPGAVRPSTYAANGSTYTVTLTGAYTEVDLSLFIELTDPANNKNLFVSASGDATMSFRVDSVAPLCNIQTPAAGQTLFGIAAVPGGNFPVSVATSSDVGMGGVSVTFTGQAPRLLTPAVNTASTTYALTGDSTYAIGATCTDASGNASPAMARNPRVDLSAPTCIFVTPANNATLAVNDVPTQVTIGGTTAGDPTTTTITSTLPGISNNTLNIVGGSASGNVSLPNGTQDLRITYADLAGNACVPLGGNQQITVTVAGMCGVSFAAGGPVRTNVNGNWLNRAGAGVTGTMNPPNATVAIAVTSDCGQGRNVYLNQIPLGGTPSGTPVVTAMDGSATFPAAAFNEGTQWTVSIEVSPGMYRQQTFFVSLRLPALASIGLQRSSTVLTVINVPPNAALVFGAATGNRRVETATATDLVFANLNGSSTAGAEFRLTLGQITDGNFGTSSGQLEFLGVAAPPMPIAVNASPFTPSVPVMVLPHQVAETTVDLVIRITSPAGNILESRHTSEVDVISPAAPSVTQMLSSPRNATADLSWMPVYDDGTDSASGGLTGGPVGQLAGYDVRWTTSSVSAGNSMGTAADFFGSASAQDGITAWSMNPINKMLTLPPINTYFIGVRARDEVGNYSTFAAPTGLANPWTTTTLTAPVASTSFGSSVVSAPIVGNDTANELIVAATGVAGGGAVYVYDSSILGASQANCGTGCQTLTPSTAVGTQFGHDLAVGNVGAVAAETRADLLVSSLGNAAPVFGRAVLFFGTTAATLSNTDAIEFRGLDTNNRIGTALVVGGAIIPDITGDGRAEIVFAVPGQATNRGRILIYRGRDRADWLTIRTATDTTVVPNVPYIPVSAATADYVIDGPSPAMIPTATNAFGQFRRGIVAVNDLDGDTFPDLAIPTSRSTINRYRLFGSVAIKASSGAAPLDATTGYVLELSTAVGTDNNTTSGLGNTTLANANFFGSSASDLVSSYPGAAGGGQVLMWSALASTPANPPVTTTLVGPLTFGSALAAGAIDSDANQDLLTATALSTGNNAFLVYQHSGTFESGTLDGAPWFWVSRFNGQSITGNINSRIGASTLLVNVAGGVEADVVLSDSVVGEVRIWR